MNSLYLDFETRSELDLDVCGVDNYVRHPSTEVLMLAWAIDEGDIRLWEPRRGPMPPELREALDDPFVRKIAWNASFERLVFRFLLGMGIPIDEWVDPMIWARHLSMPGSLEDVGAILKLKQDDAKIADGKRLLKLFCEPVVRGGEQTLFGVSKTVFRDWSTDPEDWEKFKEYCRQDVKAERTILKKLSRFPLPDFEQRGWELDQKINECGMPVDMGLVNGGAKVAEKAKEILRARLKDLTGLENPNSVPRMLEWAKGQGYPFNAMGKSFVDRALAGEGNLSPLGKEVLTIRKQASKTSDSKLERIRDLVGPDGRLRFQFAYMGAARTGRWSGKGSDSGSSVQMQNLPRPEKAVAKRLDLAISLLRAGDYEGVVREFKDPLTVVSSCLRSVFRAPDGKHFAVCDLGAVENRVLGWLSGCDGILQVFREGRDPYKSFGVFLFSTPYDQITPEQRQNSKPAVLGCFGAGTPVLTDRGWVPIAQVRKTNRVWDGISWVTHGGPLYRGTKLTINMFGVAATHDHSIHTGRETWSDAAAIAGDPVLAHRAVVSTSLPAGLRESFCLSITRYGYIPTYDLVNSGPRHRFAILTSLGPMLAHNCGYQLSGGEEIVDENGDTIKTGLLGYAAAMHIDLTPELSRKAVEVFREKYPEVTKFWRDLENGALHAIRTGEMVEVGHLRFQCIGKKVLNLILPSGRALHYLEPKIEKVDMPWGRKDCITFAGRNQSTHQWSRLKTYSGSLCENATQAVSRDLLLSGLTLADKMGFEIGGHVHDEIISLVPDGSSLSLSDLRRAMITTPSWAEGLPLDAAGYEDIVYRKD